MKRLAPRNGAVGRAPGQTSRSQTDRQTDRTRFLFFFYICMYIIINVEGGGQAKARALLLENRGDPLQLAT